MQTEIKKTIPPEVSVIVCTRNRAFCLMEAVESVLEEHGGVSFELIVVDDSDAPKRLRNEAFYGRLMENPVVRVIENPEPAGISRARNLGLDAARGEWICFLDDDDLWIKGRLRKQLSLAKEDGRGLVLGGIQYELAGRSPLRQVGVEVFKGWEDLLFETIPTGGVLFYRGNEFLRFDEGLKSAEDLDFYFRILDYYQMDSVANLAEPVLIARPMRVGSRSRLNRDAISNRSAFEVIHKRWIEGRVSLDLEKRWLALSELNGMKSVPLTGSNIHRLMSVSWRLFSLTNGKDWRRILNVWLSNISFARKFCIH